MRRVLLALAVLGSALAGLFLYVEFSAIGVILDARRSGIAGALIALLASSILLLKGGRKLLPGLLAVMSASLFGILLYYSFLAYRETEIRFQNGDVVLAGTLVSPRDNGKHPAIIFLHGSGPMTRDEFRFYAKLFARHGIAGLIYDKRGSGLSGGTRASGTYDVLAEDALAAVKFAASRPEIDPARVGIVGFSEGEWTGSLAASRSKGVAFLVVISASGVSPAEQVQYEVESNVLKAGFSAEDARIAADLNRDVFSYQRTGERRAEIQRELDAARSLRWFRAAKQIPPELDDPKEYAWWRAVMDFDATATWKKVRCPALVLIGEQNPKYQASATKAIIEKAAADSGNPDVSVRVFPKADHAMLVWWSTQRIPPPRFAPGYLDTMITWVQQRTGSVPR